MRAFKNVVVGKKPHRSKDSKHCGGRSSGRTNGPSSSKKQQQTHGTNIKDGRKDSTESGPSQLRHLAVRNHQTEERERRLSNEDMDVADQVIFRYKSLILHRLTANRPLLIIT